MVRAVTVFVSYSREDEPLRVELEKHLSSLRRSHAIADWYDRKIDAGTEWAKEIDRRLQSADVILLLISPAFIHSEYCSGMELTQAMARHEAGQACVIPIILRPADWENEPFAKLQAYPDHAKPVTKWEDRDEAFVTIVRGIRAAVTRIAERLSALPTPEEETEAIVEKIVEIGQGEEQYRDEVLFCLKQDAGEISEVSRVILNGLQESLDLFSDRARQIEAEVSRPFQIFRRAVVGLNVKSITPQIQTRLDRLQQSLKLSDEDATAIVESVVSAIADPDPIIAVPPKPSLSTFSFEVIRVNLRGQELNRRSGQANYFREKLAGGIFLDMVSIPSGMFQMDAAKGRAQNTERPQHRVTIEPIFMSKYAVTQAQWRAITQLPKINRDLEPEPSDFKGDNRPVECVSWDDAIEFCDRLNRKTGKQYRLPSEAEWEYACRAGTTTPFHFGQTITPDLANYDGNYIYTFERKGIYRKSTVEVGSLPPNAFGLYEMHGNVWEWCADLWHNNYQNARTRSDQINDLRVLRGGSWFNSPASCRSNDCNLLKRVDFGNKGGFRLAFSPRPKTS